MMIVITKQPLPCYTNNGLMCHIGNPLKKRISISRNLMGYVGNDSNTVGNIKLKNKMCRQTNDSYHPFNPLKQSISISLSLMRYVGNDSYTVKNKVLQGLELMPISLFRREIDPLPLSHKHTTAIKYTNSNWHDIFLTNLLTDTDLRPLSWLPRHLDGG